MEYVELKVWKEARSLVSEIYSTTKYFPKEELYGLTNQMRRCAISIPSNIAEGCGRSTPKDSIHFFHISRGSLYELETQVYLAMDLNYIELNDHKKIVVHIINCKKLLNGFINYYKTLTSKKPSTIND